MYTRRLGNGAEMHDGPVAGETIRKDSSGRWTTQLPQHPCLGRDATTGNGEAIYHSPGADIRMRVHLVGCTVWAEVNRLPAETG